MKRRVHLWIVTVGLLAAGCIGSPNEGPRDPAPPVYGRTPHPLVEQSFAIGGGGATEGRICLAPPTGPCHVTSQAFPFQIQIPRRPLELAGDVTWSADARLTAELWVNETDGSWSVLPEVTGATPLAVSWDVRALGQRSFQMWAYEADLAGPVETTDGVSWNFDGSLTVLTRA